MIPLFSEVSETGLTMEVSIQLSKLLTQVCLSQFLTHKTIFSTSVTASSQCLFLSYCLPQLEYFGFLILLLVYYIHRITINKHGGTEGNVLLGCTFSHTTKICALFSEVAVPKLRYSD